MRTLLIVSLAVAAAAGCKDKPKRRAPPPNVSTPPAAPKPGDKAPDLALPHSEGGSLKKTDKPHVKADYEKLSKLEFPGFVSVVRTLGEKVFEVRHMTNGHPRFWATVTIQPCLDCVPMDLEKWKAKTEDLKVLLGALKDTPGVTFEVGQALVSGTPVMYTYQFGGADSGSDKGGPQYSYTDAYAAYFNDGVNQIRVVAEYKDDPPKDFETLAKTAPKEDLQKLALAFIDVYAHAW